ncbi:hypothetical protein GTQ34_06275 [Muricauda sp. JGD-17]|uniref:HTH LytTR-type domain-containing protein n=1 Tax=Flagellimonas ochracea TaxID=2696472 RepID=A0A964TAY7_9FLAO|nr:LytTR family DNA-binding domain-containing protein [Allomuricauda ochracea]NAY91517.1 hypothetical protein [Allomuricauda ochracea]
MFQVSAAAKCFSELSILAMTSFIFWSISAPRIKVWAFKWSLVDHPKGIAIQGGLGLSASILNIVMGHLFVIFFMAAIYQCPSPSFDLLHAGLTNNIAVNILCYIILAFHFLKKNGKSPLFPIVDNKTSEHVRISVSKKGAIFLLEPEEIVYIETANNCVVLHTKKGKFVKYQSLKSLTKQLCPKTFKRVHRFYLANTNCVERITKNRNGDGFIDLCNGNRIRFSRTYLKEFPFT